MPVCPCPLAVGAAHSSADAERARASPIRCARSSALGGVANWRRAGASLPVLLARRRATAGPFGSLRGTVAMAAAAEAPRPPLMINDISGKMGGSVGEAAIAAGLTLVPFAGGGTVTVGGVKVTLVETAGREELLARVKAEFPGVVVVDYTLPDAVNANAACYCRHGLPFVMGTTGGDRVALAETVATAGAYAVIAPNMGKQIVALQAGLDFMATSFPGVFKDYTLTVVESHQKTKVDASGTGKAVAGTFMRMGASFDMQDIEMVRDEAAMAARMKVPPEHFLGHAFHTYRLTSADGTVTFEVQHNVCGRSVYAQGTVDAARFLAGRVAAGSGKRLYDMMDVLREGAMR